MSWVRIGSGILGAAVLTLAWGVGRETALPQAGRGWPAGVSTPAVSGHPAWSRESARSGVRIDRYGNEVERAVTDYRLDSHGDIYERHSPQTEVPRLGPPVG